MWPLALLLTLVANAAFAQKFEGLAKTPPLGWNSWNKFGCNVNEAITSPLLAGNDIRTMSRETTAILTDESVIAVNQDALGVQAFRYAARAGIEYWFKPLVGSDWAMLVLNRNADRAGSHSTGKPKA